MIYEYDPRQLKAAGGYEDDLMPGDEVTGLGLPFLGGAIIFDPDQVEMPDDMRELRWIVPSKEVLMRYRYDAARTPALNFDELDGIAAQAIKDYEYGKRWEAEQEADEI